MDGQSLNDLRQLADQQDRLNAQRGPSIGRARDDGHTWEQIAEAIRMSRAGVIKAYNQYKESL